MAHLSRATVSRAHIQKKPIGFLLILRLALGLMFLMLSWFAYIFVEKLGEDVSFDEIHHKTGTDQTEAAKSKISSLINDTTRIKNHAQAIGPQNSSKLERKNGRHEHRPLLIQGVPKFDMVPEERRKHPEIIHSFRYDWTNLEIKSRIAQRLVDHQNNCSLPLGDFQWRTKIFGLGSDLHIWGQALCNAMEDTVRIRTHNLREWIWLDSNKCDTMVANRSSILCYFPHSELRCPQDMKSLEGGITHAIRNPIKFKCDSIMKEYKKSDFRAAAIEFLFTKVAPIVVEEGKRQLNLVFPGGVPQKLITVHMRWGDKKFEKKLQSVNDYISGVKSILKQRGDEAGEAHIFLSTEDPKAVREFMAESPISWRVYIDQFYYEMLPYRPDDDPYNTVPKLSRELNGVTGLWSLGSLLVAMEANDFVLTTTSNWSRLMNELRKNVINPREKNVTTMVDLKYGEW